MSEEIKTLTRIGFKRVYNKRHPLPRGNDRKFVECRKCKRKAAYDFVPFSLSSPVITTPCGHSFRENFKEF
jgi:hypothetical protein